MPENTLNLDLSSSGSGAAGSESIGSGSEQPRRRLTVVATTVVPPVSDRSKLPHSEQQKTASDWRQPLASWSEQRGDQEAAETGGKSMPPPMVNKGGETANVSKSSTVVDSALSLLDAGFLPVRRDTEGDTPLDMLPAVTGEITPVPATVGAGYFWRLGVDGLNVGAHIDTVSTSSNWRDFLAPLHEARADREASRAAGIERIPEPVVIGGRAFQIEASGGRGGYRLLLSSESVTLRLDCGRPSNPEAKLEFAGRYFLSASLEDAVSESWRIFSACGRVVGTVVSEIHQRLDAPVTLDYFKLIDRLNGAGSRGFSPYRDAKTGRFSSVANYSTGTQRPQTLIIYSKTLEGSPYWKGWASRFGVSDDVEVMRIELRTRREKLKAFGISSLEGLTPDRLRAVWRKAHSSFLWVSPPGEVRDRRSRSRVADWWHKSADAGLAFVRTAEPTRHETTTHRMKMLTGALAGEFVESGVSALLGGTPEQFADRLVETIAADNVADVRERFRAFVQDLADIEDEAVTRILSDQVEQLKITVRSMVVGYASRRKHVNTYHYSPVVPDGNTE